MAKLVIERFPQDDDELWEFVATVWGFEIPRKNVCPNHCAPFDAFADAYFARSPVSIWKASRGLGGKSTLLGMLVVSEAVCLGAQITVLGGSAAQSQRVKEVTDEAWYSELAPVGVLARDPTNFTTNFKNGAWIRALMASQTSVRGPHPQRLRLDEIDEMDLPILEAAQGQPMETSHKDPDTGKIVLDIAAQTVMSSTHQYPDKTMTAMIKRAAEKEWPVFEWCYKDNHEDHGGWLTERAIQRKKSEVSEAMWAIEFDLQEPSFEGRAIDAAKVDKAFSYKPDLTSDWFFKGDNGEEIIIEDPIPGTPYVTGVDWAKEKDWTIIATFRTDTLPWRCVAWKRVGRKPWPLLVMEVDERLEEYEGLLAHDNTGLGTVVRDLISYDPTKITHETLGGANRAHMINEYIKAIETEELIYPDIQFAHDEHKYVTLDDLFGSGHLPDTFCAGMLAWSLRKKVNFNRFLGPVSVDKDSTWRNSP